MQQQNTHINITTADWFWIFHHHGYSILIQVCRFLLANGADPTLKTTAGQTVQDVATPSVQKVLKEEPPRNNSDIEAQLLEAAKNGEFDTVKVSSKTMPFPLTCFGSPLFCMWEGMKIAVSKV